MKKGFTLAEVNKMFPRPFWERVRVRGYRAFTLAEVLITLGVIGVVAAMTMPTLIANHKKKVVVTKMEKFYSSMNQAIKLSEVQNSEVKNWEVCNNVDPNNMYDWYKKYLDNYFTGKEIEKTADGILVKNTDGSAFGMYCMGHVHSIFCVDYKSCKKHAGANNSIYGKNLDGKNTFLFKLDPETSNFITYGSNNVLPRSELINRTNGESYQNGKYGCADTFKAYCAALIQQDGWQIADDYPVKF